MSSDKHGRKPDSQEPGPTSGAAKRLSGRAPSAWGAARDALAAIHNLDALLRSAVPYRTILDLLAELRQSAGVLRVAFETARAAEDAAGVAVGEYGIARVHELERLLDETEQRADDRDERAGRVRALAGELEASADLLALLERAGTPARTEVSVGLIVRETGRMFGSGRGREIAVRFDEASPDCLVASDPYVVGPLVTLLVAGVSAAGVASIAMRTRCEVSLATFVVEPQREGDEALPSLSMRVMPAVPPAAVAARRVADLIGARLELERSRGSIALVRVPG